MGLGDWGRGWAGERMNERTEWENEGKRKNKEI